MDAQSWAHSLLIDNWDVTANKPIARWEYRKLKLHSIHQASAQQHSRLEKVSAPPDHDRRGVVARHPVHHQCC
jgi:hypothetical protein